MDFSYNRTVYSPDLADWAQAMAHILPDDVAILTSSSSSGCAVASAIIVAARIQHGRKLENVFVRKNGEQSHCDVSMSDLWWIDSMPNKTAAFVDDFVFAGDTFERVFKKVGAFIDIKYVLTLIGPGTDSSKTSKLARLKEISGVDIQWVFPQNPFE